MTVLDLVAASTPKAFPPVEGRFAKTTWDAWSIPTTKFAADWMTRDRCLPFVERADARTRLPLRCSNRQY